MLEGMVEDAEITIFHWKCENHARDIAGTHDPGSIPEEEGEEEEEEEEQQ